MVSVVLSFETQMFLEVKQWEVEQDHEAEGLKMFQLKFLLERAIQFQNELFFWEEDELKLVKLCFYNDCHCCFCCWHSDENVAKTFFPSSDPKSSEESQTCHDKHHKVKL